MHISSSYAKILGEIYFAHGRFSEVGQKQNTEKERKRERKRERLNDGDNNGQVTHGARKQAWRTQAAWANKSRIIGFVHTSLSPKTIQYGWGK